MTSSSAAPTVVVGDARLARMVAAAAADLGVVIASRPSGASDEVLLPVCRSVPVWPDWADVFATCGVTAAAAPPDLSSAAAPGPRLSLTVVRSPSGQAVAYPIAAVTLSEGRRVVVAPAPELPDHIHAALTLAGLELLRRHRAVGVYRLEVAADHGARQGAGEGTGGETEAPAYRLLDVIAGADEPADWTLDACVTGHYEQQLRAVLDLPLGDPALQARWTVAAWAYDQGHGPVYPAYRHVLARDPAIRIRLYGGDVPSGQALGLVAASGPDLAPVLERAEHAADYLTGVVTE